MTNYTGSQPISGAYNPGVGFPISSGYPTRTNFIDPHFGIDFAALRGTAIPVAAEGVIVDKSINANNSYGNYVVIKHTGANGVFYTLYAHMDSASHLNIGNPVNAGQTIGVVGSSGVPTNPNYPIGVHLHFEVRTTAVLGNSSVNTINPLTFNFEGTGLQHLIGTNPWGDKLIAQTTTTNGVTSETVTLKDPTCSVDLNTYSTSSAPITDALGNTTGWSVVMNDSSGHTAIVTTLKADGSIASQTFSNGTTLVTTQSGITTTTDIATGITTADVPGLGANLAIDANGNISAGNFTIAMQDNPLNGASITINGQTYSIPAGANIQSNGEGLIIQGEGANGLPSMLINANGTGVIFNYKDGVLDGAPQPIGNDPSLANSFWSLAQTIGNAVLDFLIPSAYGSDTISNADGTKTITSAGSSGSQFQLSYDANGGISGITVQTSDIGGISTTVTANAATGTTFTQNIDSITGQMLSASTIDTSTNSGTTQTYTNGVLTSKIDFGATTATTTNYDLITHLVTGTATINSDNSGSSAQFDNYGNTIASTITNANGATTTATTLANGTVATKYPDGTITHTVINGEGLPTVTTELPGGSISVVSYSTLGTSISLPDGTLSNMVEQTGNAQYAYTLNTDGSSSTVHYNTDGSGSIINNNPDGSFTSQEFNGNGGITHQENFNQNGIGNIVNYDNNGNITTTAVMNTDGSSTIAAYYSDGSPQDQWNVSADGASSHVSYNADGSTGSYNVTNPDGSTSTGGYNTDGTSFASVTNTDGSSVSTTYDASGNPASMVTTDQYGQVLSSETYNADGSSIVVSKTPDGTATTEVSSSGTIRNVFIPLSAQIRIDNPDGSKVVNSYLLDGTLGSKRTTFVDGSGLSAVFDQYGDPSLFVVTNADGSGSETAYGPGGYTLSFGPGESPFYVPHSATSSPYTVVSSNNLDGMGGISSRSVATSDSTTITTTYHPSGRMATIAAVSADSITPTAPFTLRQYHSRLSVGSTYDGTSVFNYSTNPATVVSKTVSFSANYDESGKLVSEKFNFVGGGSDTISYSYPGEISSEVLIHSDGTSATIDVYRNGVVKELAHYNADGSVADYVRHYENGQMSASMSRQPDGSILTESYFTDGLKSSGMWTNRPDGSTVTYTGIESYANAPVVSDSGWTAASNGNTSSTSSAAKKYSFTQVTQYVDGSSAIEIQDVRGNATTTNYDANGVKLSDSWSKANGLSGTDVFNTDGSTNGTIQYPSGVSATIVDDGMGNTITRYFDEQGNEVGDSWANANGETGFDNFGASGNVGTVSLSNGESYRYFSNHQGDKAYQCEFKGLGGSIEIPRSSGQGNNAIIFAPGVNLSDLKLSAVIGGDGLLALRVELKDGNVLIIDGGLEGAISSFAFGNGTVLSLNQLMAWGNTTEGTVVGIDGDLVFSTSSFDTLVGSSGNDTLVSAAGMGVTLIGGAGHDTFVVSNSTDVILDANADSLVESSASFSLAENAVGATHLTLTGSANLVGIGSDLSDVITANSGDDILIGGAGDDLLIGGAGYDTFKMSHGMGSDIVLAYSMRGASVLLDVGLSLSDLELTRQGDDLLMKIGGSTDGMTIKDYYLNLQTEWTIKDSAGQSVTPQDLFAPIRNDIAQLEQDFLAQIKLQNEGVSETVIKGNRWFPPEATNITGSMDVQHNVTYLNGVSYSYVTQENSVPSYNEVMFDISTSVQQTEVTTDAAEIYATTTTSSTKVHDIRWALATSNVVYALWVDSTSRTAPVLDGMGNVIGYDQQKISLNNGSLSPTGLWALGGTILPYQLSTLTELPTTPQSGTVNGTYAMPVDFVHNHVIKQIQKINIGNGDHIVYGDANTVVNAGSGNNVINDAGFVYTGFGNDTVYNAGTVYCGTGNNLIVNASYAQAGSGNDTMIGGGTLIAGNGNDLLIGGEIMVAGRGNDQIYAGQGAATIEISTGVVNNVIVGGAGGNDPIQILDAIYRSMDIYDWQVSYQNAGSPVYFLNTEAGSGYFDAQGALQQLQNWGWSDVTTIQQALDYGYATDITPPPLPVLIEVHGNTIQPSAYYATSDVPVITFLANDYQTLSDYNVQDFLPQHVVNFSQGISSSDLNLSWGEIIGSITGLPTDPQLRYRTLNVTWGTNNQNVQVLIPHYDDPLGAGVSQFNFTNPDGTTSTLSMADMIAMAPTPPTFDPQLFQYQLGMGSQVLEADSGCNEINFGSGITSNMITLGLGSLMIRVGDNGDVIHIANFDPANALATNSIQHFNFEDGTSLTYEQLLSRGFDIYGTTGNEVLSGTNLDNRIYAGPGNDTLIGTGANDTLISGAGIDTLIGGTGNETFVINNTADIIIANANAASNSVVSSVSYVMSENIQNLTLVGSDNLIATGNDQNNIIIGNAGSSTLIAGAGDDMLIAGSGITTLVGGSGNNTFVINKAADVIVAEASAASNSVVSSVSYALTDNVQNLTLVGNENLTASGNDRNNIITGNAGYDTLIAGVGDDTLVAGTGGGIMVGGVGNDTFVFNLGSGQQTLIDSLSATGDVIRFGAGVSSKDVNFKVQGSDVLLSFSLHDSVLIKDFDLYGFNGTETPFQTYQFSDGSSLLVLVGNNYDGAGSYGINIYDAQENLIGDQSGYSDGGHNFNVYHLDGSSSGANFNQDGSSSTYTIDSSGNNTLTYFDNDSIKTKYEWWQTDGSYGSETFNSDGSSYGETYFQNGAYSKSRNDGHGYAITTNYDSANHKVSDVWSKADGSHGEDSFNPDGSGSGTADYLDGRHDLIFHYNFGYVYDYTIHYDRYYSTIGYSSFVDQGDGYTSLTDFDVNGVVLKDGWTNVDGTYGNDLFNADGSISGSVFQVDGSYNNYVDDGQGTITTTSFDTSGNQLGFSTTFDDGQGNISTTNYDSVGVVLSDSWENADGTYGDNLFNPDGSSSCNSYAADGSYSNYVDDGQGGVTTNYFDTTGNKLSDVWSNADGSHGSDTFNADGTSSGSTYQVDGSFSNYTNDGIGSISGTNYDASGNQLGSHSKTYDVLGNITTTIYDLNGVKLSDSWANADGTHGGNVFNSDGSSSGNSYIADGSYTNYVDDGLGGVVTTSFDAASFRLSDVWSKADGSHGSDMFNVDGSSSGTAINFDGSYSSYANDGQGNASTNEYDANGTKLRDTWSNADGTNGNNVFNTDGSSISTSYNVDGSHVKYFNYLQLYGYTVTQQLDVNGNLTLDSYQNVDGSFETDTFNADGSGNYVYQNSDGSHGQYIWNADGSGNGTNYNVDGSYSTDANDVDGNSISEFFDANNNKLSDSWAQSDGSYGDDVFNSDGSSNGTSHAADGNSSSYINDGHGAITTTNYDASGFKLTDSWTKADGSYGTDAFNADGSSTGTTYQVDGTYSTYTNDGLGHIVTVNFDANGNPTNSAPLLSAVLADVSGQQGQIFSFTIPQTTFIDPNVGDTLTLSIAMADSSALPSWLNFDAATQTFSGIPSNADVGNLGIVVTATDSSGLSVSTAFNLSVANVNDAPEVTMQIADQLLAQGTPLNLALPAGMFTDQDLIHGDSLTYSATLADGTPLPIGLNIDSTTGSLSGTAGVGDLGAVSIAITATDLGGLSATAQFNLTVANVITGTIYNDTLNGTTGADFIQSLAGNDVVNAGDGNDVIVGGAGSDVLTGGAGDDIFKISGTDAAYDRFQGDAGFDSIVGGDANDTIRVNYFSGASTVELIDGGLGLNVVAGSQYNDTIDMSGTELINIANIEGGVGNDVITGSAGNDTIIGGVGSDVLAGGAGDDTFLIDGIDVSYDRFQGDVGFDTIQGGTGDDVIRVNYFSGASTVERIDGGAGLNTIEGSQYNDTVDLSGTELANIANIDGGIGNDVITGSSGNDTIIGGVGSDVLAGGLGDDTFLINGTDAAYDRFQGGDGFDVVLGSSADDTIRVNYFSGASTVERIDGGAGLNTIEGSQYNDTIDLAGTELVNIANIDGGIGNDVITGSAGNDIIIGGADSDVLAGGLGDDTFLVSGTDMAYDRFQGDAGYDVIQGDAGDDTFRVNYFSGASTVEKIDGGLGINVIAGSQYNDTLDLLGTELVNIANIDGGVGNDVITGSAGGDIIIGGIGSDVLAGGAGDDTFLVNGSDVSYDRFQGDSGYDVIQGGAQDDVIRVNYFSGASTVEKIDGGAGINTLEGSQYNDTIDLAGTELTNIAHIDGGIGNDVISGSIGNDVIIGGSGSDVLAGGAGDDIFQINGNDTAYDRFQGDAGFDSIVGGAGDDVIRVNYFAGASAVERIDGGAGLNIIAGSQYNDTLDLSGTELLNIGKIDGGVGNDVITGSTGNDILQGGLGSDSLLDTSGNNILDGGDGGDVLTGGAGNELFIGGTGNDTITTGNGADIIAFNRGDGMDTVNGGIGTDNTISFGKGINYSDIALSKVNNNLILEVGAGEQITLTNWYNTAANYKSVIDLQVMADAMTAFDATSADPLLNQAVQNFDFTAIVNAFDQANGGSATFMHWSATNSLLTSHLSGSDTTALGGDLAHQYGTNGTLAGMNLSSAQTALNDPVFGGAPQTLRPLQGLQGGL